MECLPDNFGHAQRTWTQRCRPLVYYRELAESYRRVRRFLPTLLRTPRFGSTPSAETVIEALNGSSMRRPLKSSTLAVHKLVARPSWSVFEYRKLRLMSLDNNTGLTIGSLHSRRLFHAHSE
jgi:hypothetical protein